MDSAHFGEGYELVEKNTFLTVEKVTSRRRCSSCPSTSRPGPVCNIIVRNIPCRYDRRRILIFILRHGVVFAAVNLPMDRKSGNNKGYFFLEVPDEFLGTVWALGNLSLSPHSKKLTSVAFSDGGNS